MVKNILLPPSVDEIISKYSSIIGVTKLDEWVTKLKVNFTTSSSSSVTLLAPTDAAFTSAETKLGFPFDLRFWSGHLRRLLLNHVITTESSPTLSSQLVSNSLNNTATLLDTGVDRHSNTARLSPELPVGGSTSIQPTSSSGPLKLGPFNALVSSPDHMATNGVVRAVTEMIPPVSMTQNMYEWIKAGQNYTIFITLIETAGLVSMLTDFTVYGKTLIVPSDDAFKPYADVVEFLKKPNNDKYLRAVLQSHVFFYNLYSETVTSETMLMSFLKTTGFVFTEKSSGVLTINGVPFPSEDAVCVKK